MAQDPDYPDDMKVIDAISGIVAMTARQIADRAGVKIEVVQKVLKRDAYFIESQGQKYRYENAAPWCVMHKNRPLPSMGVAHSITSAPGTKYGYTVEIHPPREVKIPDPPKPDPPKAPEKGQFHFFPRKTSSAA